LDLPLLDCVRVHGRTLGWRQVRPKDNANPKGNANRRRQQNRRRPPSARLGLGQRRQEDTTHSLQLGCRQSRLMDDWIRTLQ
jgi:hypothetical protein